jgi:hypothetical protein
VTTSSAQPGSPAPLDAGVVHTTRNGSGSDAAIIAALERIERRLARLESSVERVNSLARGAPALIATVTDSFDGVARRAAEAGIDVDERTRAALTLLERLTAPEVAGPLTALFAKALPEGASHTPQPIGLWGAFRALKEPDVQCGLGFLLDVTRRLGASLSTQQLPARSSKGR